MVRGRETLISVIVAYGRWGKIVNVKLIVRLPSERKGKRVMDSEEERGRGGPCYETPSKFVRMQCMASWKSGSYCERVNLGGSESGGDPKSRTSV